MGSRLTPREINFYLNLGYIYFQTGIFSNALEELKAAVNLEPNRSDIYQKLGLTYEKLGQNGLAAESFANAQGPWCRSLGLEKRLNFSEKLSTVPSFPI